MADAPAPDPILIGLLFDFPQGDGGDSFVTALDLGLADATEGGRLDRPVKWVSELSKGLPVGSAANVERAFARLDDADVLAIVGPSISDNGLVVRDLADAAGISCINYTGGELTRSEYMFHYQVGSLEEEPIVLAEHLVDRGLRRPAVIYDASPVGRRYADSFESARRRLGLETAATAEVSPMSETLDAVMTRARAADPDCVVYLGLGMAARAVAVTIGEQQWDVPCVANSALMFGYARRDWRAGWEGWVYIDTIADDNPLRQSLKERSPASAAGPVGVAAYDMGRLLGDALARCEHLTREGVRDGLERVKRLPASSGYAGTTMGFGCYDHGALKGDYLVLRSWIDGRTVQYGTAPTADESR